jgi:catechol 2,3-dioxygenase-like lactoylglutathione lyase family enzyme
VAWYRERLGFEFAFEVENGVILERGESSLWLAQAASPETARSVDTANDVCMRLMGFEVSQDELRRVPESFPEDQGVVFTTHDRYDSCIVEDPDGHAIEFYAMKPGAPSVHRGQKIVAVVDVAGFAKAVRDRQDEDVFHMLDGFYRRVERSARSAGGHTLKYMGDAVVLLFPLERARDVVALVESLPEDVRSVWEEQGVDCRVHVKADVLSLVWGRIGGSGRFDIVGRDLNTLFSRLSEGRSVCPALWDLACQQSSGADSGD